MYSLKIHFERFDDVLLYRLVGSLGVYVIWDSQAQARPTYVGEGEILKRLTSHATRFATPWNGYVAILSGTTPRILKAEARAVEYLLLRVALETDRSPAGNSHAGAARIVRSFAQDGLFKVRVTGFDPLLPPRESRPLQRPKVISVRSEDKGLLIEHDWRLRRLRTAR